MGRSGVLDLSLGTVLDQRFVIEGVLGSGAMATVVAAQHIGLRCRVALKLLRPELCGSGDLVTRFLREARAAARLKSEHVVNIMDVGTLSAGVPYIVMELLEGTDMAALLEQRGRLSVDEVVEYALQILEALSEAHRAGIVHRDLKPANLFLVERDGEPPVVKVFDFGISKHFSRAGSTQMEELTRPATILGSPLYMSPEQLRDARSVDARTDLWAVGVILYEMLTGQTPFDAESVPAVIAAITSDEPAPVRHVRPEIPDVLAGVIARCLTKDRAERFADVEELARALSPLATTPDRKVWIARITRTRSSAPPPNREIAEPARVPPAAPASGSLHDTIRSLPPEFDTTTLGNISSLNPVETAGGPLPEARRGSKRERDWRLGAIVLISLSAGVFTFAWQSRKLDTQSADPPAPFVALEPGASLTSAAASPGASPQLEVTNPERPKSPTLSSSALSKVAAPSASVRRAVSPAIRATRKAFSAAIASTPEPQTPSPAPENPLTRGPRELDGENPFGR